MPKRWSKLQSRLYNLMEPSVGFQIHCALYEMNSNDGWHGSKLPRYFITIGKEIVFDYPKNYDTKDEDGLEYYPWGCDIDKISDLIEEYIQRPRTEIMNPFENDMWGLTDILRVCDRRLGRLKLLELKGNNSSEAVLRIIDKRLQLTDS